MAAWTDETSAAEWADWWVVLWAAWMAGSLVVLKAAMTVSLLVVPMADLSALGYIY
jgi:hypothetical protein